MNDYDLINTLIIIAGVESKQPGAMPMEDNPVYLAAMRLKDLKERIAGQASALRRIRSVFRDDDYDAVSSVKALRELALVIDQTGEQHLNELLAQAGREGFMTGLFSEIYNPTTVWNREERADNYANQLRNGVQK